MPRVPSSDCTGIVYDSWCRLYGAGHSCVNVNCQSRAVCRWNPKMFWTTCGSWLKASSTRKELSMIFHSEEASGAACASASRGKDTKETKDTKESSAARRRIVEGYDTSG